MVGCHLYTYDKIEVDTDFGEIVCDLSRVGQKVVRFYQALAAKEVPSFSTLVFPGLRPQEDPHPEYADPEFVDHEYADLGYADLEHLYPY